MRSDGPSSDGPRIHDPVMQAAYESVLDIGLRRTTLAEVARRAGVSRMTVYRRYEDLSEIISALMTEEFGHLVTDIAQSTGPVRNDRERLATEVVAVARATAEHPLLRRVLKLDPEVMLPLIVDRLGSSHRIGLARITALVGAGQGDGSVRAGNVGLMALQVLSMATAHVFSDRPFATLDPDGERWAELRHAIDAYLAPNPNPQTSPQNTPKPTPEPNQKRSTRRG